MTLNSSVFQRGQLVILMEIAPIVSEEWDDRRGVCLFDVQQLMDVDGLPFPGQL